VQGGPEAAKQIHMASSGIKAAATWQRKRILGDCRECCGGQGFAANNRIGPYLNDMDVVRRGCSQVPHACALPVLPALPCSLFTLSVPPWEVCVP
jgi:hypothetical protein